MSLVFFGIGNIAKKTIQKLGLPHFCVDNSSATWNTKWAGTKVYSPSKLRPNDNVIICTTSYKSVVNQLHNLGIKKYKISPILDDYVLSDKIEDINFDLLIASGLPSSKKNSEGGGIYRLKGNFKKWSITKIYSGNCHCILRNNNKSNKNRYFVSDSNKGLICFDRKMKKVNQIDFPLNKRIHGFEVFKNILFIACSYGDEVISIDLNNLKKTDTFTIREIDLNNSVIPQHHVNDLFLHDESLYVTMFSNSGNWQQGFLDGCIKKISLKTKECVTVKSNLRMPHNILINQIGYFVCNSLDGEIIHNDNIIFKSNGFTRGLYIENEILVVGESKNRNFSFNKSNNLNSSLDTKINFVDLKTGVYKSIQLPWGISEIHSIARV